MAPYGGKKSNCTCETKLKYEKREFNPQTISKLKLALKAAKILQQDQNICLILKHRVQMINKDLLLLFNGPKTCLLCKTTFKNNPEQRNDEIRNDFTLCWEFQEGIRKF